MPVADARTMTYKIPMKPFELIHVQSLEATCDGGGGALGHPKVYLHIDQDKGLITCPYCSRTYVLKMSAVRAAGGHHS